MDHWYFRRRDDELGKYYWHVVQQGFRREQSTSGTRQGLYGFTHEGTLLGSNHVRPPAEMVTRLEAWRTGEGLGVTDPGEAPPTEPSADPGFVRDPPEGGLIVKIYSRILMDDPPTRRLSNMAFGMDHLWLQREELAAMAPGDRAVGDTYPIPASVAMRIARFHLIDNVRGEPPMWGRNDVQEASMALRVDEIAGDTVRLTLRGAPKLATAAGDRGYEAELLGFLTWDRRTGAFTRFDAVTTGLYWGEGRYTRGAPPGKFPFAVSFSIATDEPQNLVPPQGARNLDNYYRADR